MISCFTGSNGSEFMFLLKGHEDLRQDERVMQLFGLVNTLLANDPETFYTIRKHPPSLCHKPTRIPVVYKTVNKTDMTENFIS